MMVKGGKKAFLKKYVLKEELGSGEFAEVYLATLKDNKNEEFAVKKIKESKLKSREDLEYLKMEIDILKNINFHGIIKLYEVFQVKNSCYLVTELANGGNLFDKILRKKENNISEFSEKEAALIIMQIAESLKYCHNRNIVHRDLKPENILFDDYKETSRVKLADFGAASYCKKELNDICGNLVYVAPEMLRGYSYKTEPDMWSLGIITYILLCGYPPFFERTQEELSKKIVRGRYKFIPEDWNIVSDDAKDFVRGLLKRDCTSRMTAGDVLNHPWIANYATLSNTKLDMNQKLKEFQAEMLLKSAFLGLQAIDKLTFVLKDFDPDAPQTGEEENVEGA